MNTGHINTGLTEQEIGSSRDIQSKAFYLLFLLNCLLSMAGFNITQNKNTVTIVTVTVYCLKKGK